METKQDIFLGNEFLKQFKIDHNKDFIVNDETITRLNTLTDYFAESDLFFNSSLLIKTKNNPSFDKGLFIIGDFGTGKSTMLTSIVNVLNSNRKLNILAVNAQKVIHEYESLENSQNKKGFYRKYSKGQILFDDILTEDKANNYGTKNVFKELLEVRYDNEAKTYIICNYDPKFPRDVEKALDQFLLKYGGRVYDRLFEMFNIIEFQGISMRK
jgi:DNA replication protein DnaC